MDYGDKPAAAKWSLLTPPRWSLFAPPLTLYLMREADSNGFKRVGITLEEVERAIDEELDMRGLSQDGANDRIGQSGSNLN